MKNKFQEFTDSQWQVIEKILNDQRKRKHSLRTIINAIFFINNTGVQWRNLDSKYPPWETVFYHFTQLKARGIWEEILDSLVIQPHSFSDFSHRFSCQFSRFFTAFCHDIFYEIRIFNVMKCSFLDRF